MFKKIIILTYRMIRNKTLDIKIILKNIKNIIGFKQIFVIQNIIKQFS